MGSLPPIPTPGAQRWREFRIQLLPIIVFVGILTAIAIMWKNFVQPPGVFDEVEAVKVNATSPREGAIAELRIQPPQAVTNEQALVSVQR